ncbi:MAG: FAD:protein FMN transferase [Planctomycetia bacterium]
MEDREVHTLVVGRDAMACRFEAVFNAGEVPEATAIAVDCLDLVEEIENRISIYRETSEFSRLNARAAEGWQPLAADTLELLLAAQGLHERTAGAFDIASGALTRAWGFLARQGRTPSPEDLATAREASGMEKIDLDAEGARLRFRRSGVELNPGAIGKGWALDRMVERLRIAGVENALVHGGSSSVRSLGTRADRSFHGGGWPVGIRHPLRPGRRLATVHLADGALGTSGSGTQFFIDRGRRLGHILDPRSGVPAEGVLSATVIAPTAAEADSLSTALFVLGPPGLDLVAPPGGTAAAVMVVPGEAAGAVKVLAANLAADAVAFDPGPDVEL